MYNHNKTKEKQASKQTNKRRTTISKHTAKNTKTKTKMKNNSKPNISYWVRKRFRANFLVVVVYILHFLYCRWSRCFCFVAVLKQKQKKKLTYVLELVCYLERKGNEWEQHEAAVVADISLRDSTCKNVLFVLLIFYQCYDEWIIIAWIYTITIKT